MKHKLTIVAMILMAALFIASPVLAAGSSRIMEVGKKWEKPTVISLTGTITALEGGEIDIDVQMTNKAFIQYRGKPLTVYTQTSTLYIKWEGKKRTYIKWPDLIELFNEPGDLKVSINARLDGGQFKARLVQVYQPRIPQ